jgi:hypothetical protein
MRTLNVELKRQWSEWGPGEIVRLPRDKAERVIAEGFGVATKAAATAVEVRGAPPQRCPRVETADAVPAAETAAVTPETRPRRRGARTPSTPPTGEMGAATTIENGGD